MQLAQASPFPLLRSWVVYFKDAKNIGQVSSSVGERVESGPKEHVLGDAMLERVFQFVLCIAVAHHHNGTEAAEFEPVQSLV